MNRLYQPTRYPASAAAAGCSEPRLCNSISYHETIGCFLRLVEMVADSQGLMLINS